MIVRRMVAAALVVAALTSFWSTDASAADADPWTGTDKTLHFAVSSGIAVGAYTGGALFFDARRDALIFGGAVTLAIGAGKEIADLAGAGDPSWKDFTWDAIGAVAGLALAWGIDLLVRGVSDERPALSSPRPAPSASQPHAPLVFSF